jgi:hypothetical protein
MKALLLLSAVAASSVAATLNAQVTPAKPDSSCITHPDGRVECRIERRSAGGDSAFRYKVFNRMDSAMAKRAALGLELRATGTRRDTLGVLVEAVTPKGPAETAGIIEGDRIAAINGVDLRTSAADVDDSYTNGLAAHRLTREVRKLTPGNRVTLRVYSLGRFRDVQVTAGKASEVRRLGGRFNFGMPGPDGMMEFHGPGGAMMFGPETRMFRQQRSPRIFKAEAGDVFLDTGDLGDFEDEPMLQMDDDLFDFETEIEPVPTAVIRDLAATAIRDAQSALKQLAADRVA